MSFDAPEGVAVRLQEPLWRHVAGRVGGPCDAFVIVNRREALPGAIDACRRADWSVTLLGAGTRCLVRDGGIPGAVVRLGTDFARITIRGDVVEVGAATPVPALVAAMIEAGLSGLESLARAPGSLGALLHLDEGAWCERVEHVMVLSRGGEREVPLDKARKRTAMLLGAQFRLDRAAPEVVAAAVARTLREGSDVLPGSAYDRPGRGGLRRLLGRAGLAGVRLRSVGVPSRAPELMVNLGGAQASDFALLHRSAMDRVRRETGVELTGRLRWLGRNT